MEALEVRNQQLSRLHRQFRADRHRTEQAPHFRVRTQIRADADPKVIETARTPILRLHETAAEFHGVVELCQQSRGELEQAGAVQPVQTLRAQDRCATSNAIRAGDLKARVIPQQQLVVVGVEAIQVGALAAALADGAEAVLAQTCNFAHQRTIAVQPSGEDAFAVGRDAEFVERAQVRHLVAQTRRMHDRRRTRRQDIDTSRQRR